METFPTEVRAKLGWYVYRLIDPRTGFTFYVGKGRDDRVFHHAKGLLDEDDGDDAEAPSLKKDTIRDILRTGLAVQYLIHRHGLETEDVAYEVEAALIDAYPGLTNLAGGHGSTLKGGETLLEYQWVQKSDKSNNVSAKTQFSEPPHLFTE